MNTESLNHHLATVVMGYDIELSKITNKPCKTEIYTAGGDWLETCDWIECCNFDPLNNIEQAMGCLDTFNFVSIAKSKKQKWCCSIRNDNADIWNHSGWRKTLEHAISLACARATEWDDDN